ncbi:hypothetical protein Ahia01_001000100 [Argonauta hians]
MKNVVELQKIQQVLQANREFVKFQIVNSVESKRQLYHLRRNTNIPVYQDSPYRKIWKKLKGSNNVIILYDRCGHQTFRFNQSQSLIYSVTVQKGI